MNNLLSAVKQASASVSTGKVILVPADELTLGALWKLGEIGINSKANHIPYEVFKDVYNSMCRICNESLTYGTIKTFATYSHVHDRVEYDGYIIDEDSLQPICNTNIEKSKIFYDCPVYYYPMFVLVFRINTECYGDYTIDILRKDDLVDVLFLENRDAPTRVYHSFRYNAPVLGNGSGTIEDKGILTKDLNKYYNKHDEFMYRIKRINLIDFINHLLAK